jgi:hypothetical protein
MIDSFRDASVLPLIGISLSDAYPSQPSGQSVQAAKALFRKGTLGSIRGLFEDLWWIIQI